MTEGTIVKQAIGNGVILAALVFIAGAVVFASFIIWRYGSQRLIAYLFGVP